MSEKKYYGNGKEIETQYGPLLKLSFNKTDLEDMLTRLNAKGWLNLNVNRRQSPSEWGHTHSIQLDTYEPPKHNEVPQSAPQTPQAGNVSNEQIPF